MTDWLWPLIGAIVGTVIGRMLARINRLERDARDHAKLFQILGDRIWRLEKEAVRMERERP